MIICPNGHIIYPMEELDEMHYRDMPKELREALGIKLEDKEKDTVKFEVTFGKTLPNRLKNKSVKV